MYDEREEHNMAEALLLQKLLQQNGLSDHWFGWKILFDDEPLAILEFVGSDPQSLEFLVHWLQAQSPFRREELFSLKREPSDKLIYQNLFTKAFVADLMFATSLHGDLVTVKDLRG